MPGPAPSPNARRTNDKAGWRTLAHECALPAPRWPLAGRKPAGLVELWRYLWRLPVAAIWHEQDASRLVARYALLTLANERALLPAGRGLDVDEVVDPVKTAAELRQIEDRLLISPSTRLRARVVVAERPAEAPRIEGNVTHVEFGDLDVG